MELRTISNARPAANMAKEDANTFLPVDAMPAATPIILASAMPQSMKRSGHAFLNMPVFVAAARSASSTIRSGYSAESAASASP